MCKIQRQEADRTSRPYCLAGDYLLISDWIGLSSVLRPLQHSIGYKGDGFYRSKNPTNSIKVLKEKAAKKKQRKKTQKTKKTENTHTHTK